MKRHKTQKLYLVGVLVAGCLLPASASAGAIGFSGYYDPGNASNGYLNWDLGESRLDGQPVTTGGVDTGNSPTSITIFGQDDNNRNPDMDPACVGQLGCGGNTWFTIPALAAGPVSFNYAFTTNDTSQNPAFDPFGYVLDMSGNGIIDPILEPEDFVSIVDGLTDPSSGSFNFNVAPGQIFGWYQETTDNNFGEAFTVISDFQAPMAAAPEPGGLALLGIGLAGLGYRRRRSEPAV